MVLRAEQLVNWAISGEETILAMPVQDINCHKTLGDRTIQ